MLKSMVSMIFSCLVLLFFYYTVKMFLFWFFKHVLKVKKFKDKKFKVFGDEL